MMDFSNLNENDSVELKSDLTFNNDKVKFLKLMCGFVNSHTKSDKHIYFGIKQAFDGEQNEIVGVEIDEYYDEAAVEELIYNNIEPKIKYSLNIHTHEDKRILELKILKENYDIRAFHFKKKYNNLDEGDAFIRENTRIRKMTRKDHILIHEAQTGSINLIINECFVPLDTINSNINETIKKINSMHFNKEKLPINSSSDNSKDTDKLEIIRNNMGLDVDKINNALGQKSFISVSIQEKINKFCKEKSINLKDNFYDLGDLRKYIVLGGFYARNVEYRGSKIMEEKRTLIYDLYEYINMMNFFVRLSQYKLLNIKIENKCNSIVDNLEVEIYISDDKLVDIEEIINTDNITPNEFMLNQLNKLTFTSIFDKAYDNGGQGEIMNNFKIPLPGAEVIAEGCSSEDYSINNFYPHHEKFELSNSKFFYKFLIPFANLKVGEIMQFPNIFVVQKNNLKIEFKIKSNLEQVTIDFI